MAPPPEPVETKAEEDTNEIPPPAPTIKDINYFVRLAKICEEKNISFTEEESLIINEWQEFLQLPEDAQDWNQYRHAAFFQTMEYLSNRIKQQAEQEAAVEAVPPPGQQQQPATTTAAGPGEAAPAAAAVEATAQPAPAQPTGQQPAAAAAPQKPLTVTMETESNTDSDFTKKLWEIIRTIAKEENKANNDELHQIKDPNEITFNHENQNKKVTAKKETNGQITLAAAQSSGNAELTRLVGEIAKRANTKLKMTISSGNLEDVAKLIEDVKSKNITIKISSEYAEKLRELAQGTNEEQRKLASTILQAAGEGILPLGSNPPPVSTAGNRPPGEPFTRAAAATASSLANVAATPEGTSRKRSSSTPTLGGKPQ